MRYSVVLVVCLSVFSHIAVFAQISAPGLNNCPAYDDIATTVTPVLSFFNAKCGERPLKYEIELDRRSDFSSPDRVSYKGILEGNACVPVENRYVTSMKVNASDALNDNTRYYWRVRAVDAAGNTGAWSVSRFMVDTSSDDSFMNMMRAPARAVMSSSPAALENITDYNDQGQSTFWQAIPPGERVQWVVFDLGKRMPVCRSWILSNPTTGRDNWLKKFRWLSSDDCQNWTPVSGASVEDNDTYRNILDFDAVRARYFKLEISEWYGYAPQLNCVILYTPGGPAVPVCPGGQYVLCVGNQLDGFTFSALAAKVRELGLGLNTLTVPRHEISLDLVNRLDHPPVAIILSGNNASYNELPMFEFNGEFELIRECDIPMFAICCGHQMTAMAYGFTNVRSMGWPDMTGLRPADEATRIKILDRNDRLFKGVPDPFVAPEIHSSEIAELPDNYVITAASSYVQCMKRTDKPLYTSQFHPEIDLGVNEAEAYLRNFLKMAAERGAR